MRQHTQRRLGEFRQLIGMVEYCRCDPRLVLSVVNKEEEQFELPQVVRLAAGPGTRSYLGRVWKGSDIIRGITAIRTFRKGAIGHAVFVPDEGADVFRSEIQ